MQPESVLLLSCRSWAMKGNFERRIPEARTKARTTPEQRQTTYGVICVRQSKYGHDDIYRGNSQHIHSWLSLGEH